MRTFINGVSNPCHTVKAFVNRISIFGPDEANIKGNEAGLMYRLHLGRKA